MTDLSSGASYPSSGIPLLVTSILHTFSTVDSMLSTCQFLDRIQELYSSPDHGMLVDNKYCRPVTSSPVGVASSQTVSTTAIQKNESEEKRCISHSYGAILNYEKCKASTPSLVVSKNFLKYVKVRKFAEPKHYRFSVEISILLEEVRRASAILSKASSCVQLEHMPVVLPQTAVTESRDSHSFFALLQHLESALIQKLCRKVEKCAEQCCLDRIPELLQEVRYSLNGERNSYDRRVSDTSSLPRDDGCTEGEDMLSRCRPLFLISITSQKKLVEAMSEFVFCVYQLLLQDGLILLSPPSDHRVRKDLLCWNRMLDELELSLECSNIFLQKGARVGTNSEFIKSTHSFRSTLLAKLKKWIAEEKKMLAEEAFGANSQNMFLKACKRRSFLALSLCISHLWLDIGARQCGIKYFTDQQRGYNCSEGALQSEEKMDSSSSYLRELLWLPCMLQVLCSGLKDIAHLFYYIEVDSPNVQATENFFDCSRYSFLCSEVSDMAVKMWLSTDLQKFLVNGKTPQVESSSAGFFTEPIVSTTSLTSDIVIAKKPPPLVKSLRLFFTEFHEKRSTFPRLVDDTRGKGDSLHQEEKIKGSKQLFYKKRHLFLRHSFHWMKKINSFFLPPHSLYWTGKWKEEHVLPGSYYDELSALQKEQTIFLSWFCEEFLSEIFVPLQQRCIADIEADDSFFSSIPSMNDLGMIDPKHLLLLYRGLTSPPTPCCIVGSRHVLGKLSNSFCSGQFCRKLYDSDCKMQSILYSFMTASLLRWMKRYLENTKTLTGQLVSLIASSQRLLSAVKQNGTVNGDQLQKIEKDRSLQTAGLSIAHCVEKFRPFFDFFILLHPLAAGGELMGEEHSFGKNEVDVTDPHIASEGERSSSFDSLLENVSNAFFQAIRLSEELPELLSFSFSAVPHECVSNASGSFLSEVEALLFQSLMSSITPLLSIADVDLETEQIPCGSAGHSTVPSSESILLATRAYKTCATLSSFSCILLYFEKSGSSTGIARSRAQLDSSASLRMVLIGKIEALASKVWRPVLVNIFQVVMEAHLLGNIGYSSISEKSSSTSKEITLPEVLGKRTSLSACAALRISTPEAMYHNELLLSSLGKARASSPTNMSLCELEGEMSSVGWISGTAIVNLVISLEKALFQRSDCANGLFSQNVPSGNATEGTPCTTKQQQILEKIVESSVTFSKTASKRPCYRSNSEESNKCFGSRCITGTSFTAVGRENFFRQKCCPYIAGKMMYPFLLEWIIELTNLTTSNFCTAFHPGSNCAKPFSSTDDLQEGSHLRPTTLGMCSLSWQQALLDVYVIHEVLRRVGSYITQSCLSLSSSTSPEGDFTECISKLQKLLSGALSTLQTEDVSTLRQRFALEIEGYSGGINLPGLISPDSFSWRSEQPYISHLAQQQVSNSLFALQLPHYQHESAELAMAASSSRSSDRTWKSYRQVGRFLVLPLLSDETGKAGQDNPFSKENLTSIPQIDVTFNGTRKNVEVVERRKSELNLQQHCSSSPSVFGSSDAGFAAVKRKDTLPRSLQKTLEKINPMRFKTFVSREELAKSDTNGVDGKIGHEVNHYGPHLPTPQSSEGTGSVITNVWSNLWRQSATD